MGRVGCGWVFLQVASYGLGGVWLCRARASTTLPASSQGCLSFPGFTADVERAGWIKVEFATAQGKAMAKRYSGWEARADARPPGTPTAPSHTLARTQPPSAPSHPDHPAAPSIHTLRAHPPIHTLHLPMHTPVHTGAHLPARVRPPRRRPLRRSAQRSRAEQSPARPRSARRVARPRRSHLIRAECPIPIF